jgi:hypothetical protein
MRNNGERGRGGEGREREREHAIRANKITANPVNCKY